MGMGISGKSGGPSLAQLDEIRNLSPSDFDRIIYSDALDGWQLASKILYTPDVIPSKDSYDLVSENSKIDNDGAATALSSASHPKNPLTPGGSTGPLLSGGVLDASNGGYLTAPFKYTVTYNNTSPPSTPLKKLSLTAKPTNGFLSWSPENSLITFALFGDENKSVTAPTENGLRLDRIELDGTPASSNPDIDVDKTDAPFEYSMFFSSAPDTEHTVDVYYYDEEPESGEIEIGSHKIADQNSIILLSGVFGSSNDAFDPIVSFGRDGRYFSVGIKSDRLAVQTESETIQMTGLGYFGSTGTPLVIVLDFGDFQMKAYALEIGNNSDDGTDYSFLDAKPDRVVDEFATGIQTFESGIQIFNIPGLDRSTLTQSHKLRRLHALEKNTSETEYKQQIVAAIRGMAEDLGNVTNS